ncbi:MAG: hypothetical protein OCD76_24000 [Reichenbachiella sp.]
MKEITISPSSQKLFKKTLGPAFAILCIVFFVIIPDEDLMGTPVFQLIMVIILLLIALGLIVYFFYELNRVKTKPVMQISESGVSFNRKNIQLPFSEAYSFMSINDAGIDGPESDASDWDFLVDKKETYIHVLKDDEVILKVRTTLLNIDSGYVVHLLNNLNVASKEKRGGVLELFYKELMSEISEKAKKRIKLNEKSILQIEEENLGLKSMEDLEVIRTGLGEFKRKLLVSALGMFVVATGLSIYQSIEELGALILIMSLLSPSLVAALLSLPFTLIPYQELEYKTKYPAVFLIIINTFFLFNLGVVLYGFIQS